jgi:hypothetical protein
MITKKIGFHYDLFFMDLVIQFDFLRNLYIKNHSIIDNYTKIK